MQRERRRDPYPWTWEPALVVGVLVVVGLACGVQFGRSLANLLVGAGWTWPDAPGAATTGAGSDIELLPAPSLFGGAFWRSVPQVLVGDSTAGLARPPDGAAGSGLLWGCVAVVELLVMVALVWAAAAGFRRWGPGRVRGMATRVETEQLLGVTRMRSVAAIVRPDLYGANVSRRADGDQVHLTASSGASSGSGGGWSSIHRAREGRRSQAPPAGGGTRIELGRGLSSELHPPHQLHDRRRQRRWLRGSLQRWLGWGRGDS